MYKPFLDDFEYAILSTLLCTNPYFFIHYKYSLEVRLKLEGKLGKDSLKSKYVLIYSREKFYFLVSSFNTNYVFVSM